MEIIFDIIIDIVALILLFIFSIIPGGFIAWVLKGFLNCCKEGVKSHIISLFIILVVTNVVLIWYLIAIALETTIGHALIGALFIEIWVFLVLYTMIKMK